MNFRRGLRRTAFGTPPHELDLAFEPAINEAELLARWQAEVDAYADDPDLPVPKEPIVTVKPKGTRIR